MNLRNRLPFYISLIQQGLEWFGYPLICTKAKAKPLKNYKVYGNTEQGGIPESYTRLEWIESNGTNGFLTNYYPKGDKSYVEFDGIATGLTQTKSQMLFGTRTEYKVNGFSIQTRTATSTNMYTQYYESDTRWSTKASETERHSYILDRGKCYLDTTLALELDMVAFTPANPLVVFGMYTSTEAGPNYTGIAKLYNLIIKEDDELVQHFVPAIRTIDNTTVLYDLVTGEVLEPQGEGEFTRGNVVQPTPTQPLMIESVGEKTKNIFDVNNALLGYGIGTTGIIAPTTSYNCSNYIEVEPNTTYIRLNNETPLGNYYHLYDKDKNWIERRSATSTGLMTTSADTKYIAVAIDINISLDTYQIVEGSTATAYEPYNMYKIPVNIKSENLFNPTSSRDAYLQSPSVGKAVAWRNSAATTTYIDCHRVEAGKTYTISCMTKQIAAPNARAGAIVGDDNLIKQVITTPEWVVGKNECSFVATEDGWLYVAVDINSTDISVRELDQTTNIYLSEPLRKLGDLTDYIDYAEQKVVRQVGVVNSSNFTWTKGTYGGTGPGYYTAFSSYTPTPVNNNTKVTAITEITTTYSRNVAYNDGEYLSYACFMSSTGNLVLTTRENTAPKCDIYYGKITQTEESITLPQITLPGEVTITTETTVKPSDMYGKQ